MSKVKLIICEGYGSQGRPRIGGTEKVVDLKIEIPDTHDIMGVVRTDFDAEPNGDVRSSDALDPVIRYERINDLVGKVLTILDAASANQATKDLVKQACWNWYTGQSDALTEPWRLDKFPNYARAFEVKE